MQRKTFLFIDKSTPAVVDIFMQKIYNILYIYKFEGILC